MTELDQSPAPFQAGFDLTDVAAPDWEKMLKEMSISDGVVTEVRWDWTDAVMRYWTWAGSDGFIVTRCNPVTGEHLDPNIQELHHGELSYVGIEGTKEFVDKVFDYIRKHASFSKDETYGTRGFI